MFADETNLFHTHSNIKKLFSTMNEELASIDQWFTSNKLSLNAKKKKYSCFRKLSKKDDTPLMLMIMLSRGKNLLNFSEYY